MKLTELIRYPEKMDRETLYDLRSLIALYPYHQTARILMLKNLYLLHDPTFDEELRRAAIYITDRKVLFDLIETAHYQLRNTASTRRGADDGSKAGSRTEELIDSFLETIPDDAEEQKPKGRKPTPADAAVDYVAYLLESDGDTTSTAPQMKGQSLIDDFIFRDGGKIVLPELTDESVPQIDHSREASEPQDEIITETMAQIYVRQGRFPQALDIIKRLSHDDPKRSAHFADQIRFLEKLIVNQKHKAKK